MNYYTEYSLYKQTLEHDIRLLETLIPPVDDLGEGFGGYQIYWCTHARIKKQNKTKNKTTQNKTKQNKK